MPMKLNTVIVLLLLVLFCNLNSANAQVIEDLYDAEIAVQNQSATSQKQAFTAALQQVFVKVRGNRDLLSNQQVKKALKKATSFVRSYSYEIQDSQLYLVINFDPQRVQTSIRNAGFPVWDKRRPETIVWLAIQSPDGTKRKIATAIEFPDIFQQLSLTAAERGISLMFPLWDLDDIQRLNVFDIWGGFSNQISAASERYVVPSILSARVFLSEDLHNENTSLPENENIAKQWVADWTMMEDGRLLAGQVQQENPLAVVEAIVDALADELSLKYAIDLAQIDSADTKIQIIVNNINSLEYYIQVLSFLENMSVVNSATLIQQQGTRAMFELDLLGDVEDLTNALSLDANIKPVVDDFGQPIPGLEFFWVK